MVFNFNPSNEIFKDNAGVTFFKDKLEDHRIVFFGDRTYFPGNDHALADILRNHPNGEVVAVERWEDTQRWITTEGE